ncbi:MAG: response regulator transcription factor [Dethiobacter sp.]|nr:response regulator transcription factor [Dethiobacter sp.]MBS3897399.1 response regulator transcription factor [Dethiobacter sp.]MBS3983216.1 response regulator transcription factor [Dethiobacter sp.]MCL4463134.1 response regulator transcription factor [Bacillota bacterium]MCL5994226.1 response regulator transcription factor [Bacillota bacterium]
MARILVVDDEKTIVKGLKFSLEKEGYEVLAAYDGAEALSLFKKENPDLIVLDLMLPEVDGFEVCRRIRKGSEVPIIMLTARGEDIDKILGLELGADDYVTKPFNPRELTARIKAILRRSQLPTGKDQVGMQVIRLQDLQIDLFQRKVRIRDKEVDLTSKEFALLSLLASHPGRVFSREKLLEHVWGYDYYGDARTVDVHIRHMREKIEPDPATPQLILTVWGAGYKFREAKNV